jgi:oligopeptide transport system ATP-binding protein
VSEYLLEVQELKTHFKVKRGYVQAVNGISFTLKAGERVALVGESGCGKSVTALSTMRLVDQPPGEYRGGQIYFEDENLLALAEKEMRKIRGGRIGMIFQDPMTCLNPTMTVGKQIAEGLLMHLKLPRDQARARAIQLLKQVGIPDATQRFHAYPHEFSGGMRQRVMIAIALSCNPRLLIADEPTTALDVTVQAQILELISSVCQESGTALLLITHDLGVVAGMTERVIVMYAGKIVEEATTEELFAQPRHPYTVGLLASVPRLDEPRHEELPTIEGAPPDLLAPPPGCPFMPRCFFARKQCLTLPPLEPLVSVPSNGSRKDIDSYYLPRGQLYTSNPNKSSGNAPGHDTIHSKACWVDITDPQEQAYAARRRREMQERKEKLLATNVSEQTSASLRRGR